MDDVMRQETAVSTTAMRAEADQINASVREDNRALQERAKRAAQLVWEADLRDKAKAAKDAHDNADRLLPDLEAAVTVALAAERAAEDRLRADERRLARRTAELQKARADHAPAARREDLAARVPELTDAVADDREDLGKARRDREQAEADRDSQDAQVRALYAVWAEADRAARNPGTAPGLPGFAPGVARISDLGEEERQYLQAAVLMAFAGRSEPAPAKPDRAELLKDQTRWRAIAPGVLLPPRMPA